MNKEPVPEVRWMTNLVSSVELSAQVSLICEEESAVASRPPGAAGGGGGGCVTVHMNVTVPVPPRPSCTVTATFVETAAALTVPAIRPVDELMDRPAGSPEAL